MLIYTYDEQGFFVSTSTAQKHPLKAGFLYPKNSTTEALPSTTLEAYQSFKFDGTNWTVENIQAKIDDLLATTNAKGSLLYEDVAGLPVARDVADVLIDDTTADDNSLKQTAFDEMQTDIYDELEILYGTRSAATATAAALTWDLLESKPELYFNEGLLAEHALTGIAIGDALDTEAKVLDYATQLNAKKVTYSKYRMARIKTYKEEIAVIES